MNIAIIGATGNTGLEFLKQALNRGHSVTALARSPHKITMSHSDLSIIKGSVLNAEDVQQAVLGKDAVFISLGTGQVPKKSTIRTDGTSQVINVLEKAGEQTLVVVMSSLGTNESMRQVAWYYPLLLNLLLGRALADHATQESAVRNSALPYLILRPTNLSDEAHTKPAIVTAPPNKVRVMPSIPRASVVTYALDQIEASPTESQAVALTYS